MEGLLFDEDDRWTVSHAREWMLKARKKGTTCPVCIRFTREYSRAFNSGMAATLIWLVGAYQRTGDYLQYQKVAPKHVIANREIGKVKSLWGLAESPPPDDPSKRNSGFWRPTKKGMEAVLYGHPIPSHAREFDGKLLELSETKTTVRKALGKHFNFDELMRGI